MSSIPPPPSFAGGVPAPAWAGGAPTGNTTSNTTGGGGGSSEPGISPVAPWMQSNTASAAPGGMLAGLMASSAGTPPQTGSGFPVAAASTFAAAPSTEEEEVRKTSQSPPSRGSSKPGSKVNTPSSATAPPVAPSVPMYPFGAPAPHTVPANPPPTWGVPSAPSQQGGGAGGGAHTPSAMPPPFSVSTSPGVASATSSSLPFGGAGGVSKSVSGTGSPFGGPGPGGFGGSAPQGGGPAFGGGGAPMWGVGPAVVSSTGVSSTVFDFFAQSANNASKKSDQRNNREDEFVTLSSDPDCEDRPAPASSGKKNRDGTAGSVSPSSSSKLRTSGRLHERKDANNATPGTTSSPTTRGSMSGLGSTDSIGGGQQRQSPQQDKISEQEQQRLEDQMYAAQTFDVKPGALLDFLFLGNVKDAEDEDFLTEFNITDIINVGSSTYPAPTIKVPNPNGDGTFVDEKVRLHHFPAEDKPDFPIFSVFEQCFREIDRVRAEYWICRGHKRGSRMKEQQAGAPAAGQQGSGGSPERTRQSTTSLVTLGGTPSKETTTTPVSGIVGGANPTGTNASRSQPPAVLLHCEKGISRSATVSIAYLVKRNGWDVADAHHYVQSRRRIIEPNYGFMESLKKYETALSTSIPNETLTEDARQGYGVVGQGITEGGVDGAKIIQRKRRALICTVKGIRPEVTEQEVLDYFEYNVGTLWTAYANEMPNSDGTKTKIWMLAFTMLESCREAAKQNRALVASGQQHPLTAPGQPLVIAAARLHTSAHSEQRRAPTAGGGTTSSNNNAGDEAQT